MSSTYHSGSAEKASAVVDGSGKFGIGLPGGVFVIRLSRN